MGIPRASALHHIYKGKKAYANVAKLQVWRDHNPYSEPSGFLVETGCPDEGNGMAGQAGKELHPGPGLEPGCAGTWIPGLEAPDAPSQLRDQEAG
jgi:hypothetical protein